MRARSDHKAERKTGHVIAFTAEERRLTKCDACASGALSPRPPPPPPHSFAYPAHAHDNVERQVVRTARDVARRPLQGTPHM
eukprot:21395-Prymnesium_polylepis.1